VPQVRATSILTGRAVHAGNCRWVIQIEPPKVDWSRLGASRRRSCRPGGRFGFSYRVSKQDFNRGIGFAEYVLWRAFQVDPDALHFQVAAYDLLTSERPLEDARKKFDASDFPGAIADYTRHLRSAPDDVLAYLERARCHDRLGDYAYAAEDADRAIRLDPGRADAYYFRGRAPSLLRRPRGALADYTKTIGLQQDHRNVYFHRGLARYRKKTTGAR
jgi:tetratricopeptide (TPR) repeat protein